MNEITLAALDSFQELLEAAPRSATDPLERREGFVLSRLHSTVAQRGIQSLVFSDQISHALGAEGPKRFAALRNRGRKFVRSCLREAGEKGLLREDLDIEGAFALVTGMVMGFLFAAKDGDLPSPAGEMGRRCWRTLRSALAQKQVLS